MRASGLVVTLARCLMVQGSASSVGKSFIATALCRVLHEGGVHVAPFKAQNMSLNAAVTADGGEIGRAQAAQAEAAGLAPRAAMNPILLKPEADTRSQLIVMGKTTGRYAARSYWEQGNDLWPVVRGALAGLRREFDVVVIEGAGSPAELNLRHVDIANMRVAEEADASVILVGDIERGGIFAQLLGTLDLLSAAERARVRALVVNKFRGDRTLFDEGVRILQERTGLPVHVLPYLSDHLVPSEDALATPRAAPPNAPDIAIVAYPHVSNHDDFELLSAAGARVRYVRSAEELGQPDLVVLPGSKNTISDLNWLRERQIDERISSLSRGQTPVLGVCGGFQMLGRSLSDPEGVEGEAAAVPGLGLLPVDTVFAPNKTTRLVRGQIRNPGFIAGARDAVCDGYEIHLGHGVSGGAAPFCELRAAGEVTTLDGAVSEDGLTIGTYVHGLFRNEPLRDALLSSLAARKGSDFTPIAVVDDAYSCLSEWLRSSLDVNELLAQCGIDHLSRQGASARVEFRRPGDRSESAEAQRR